MAAMLAQTFYSSSTSQNGRQRFSFGGGTSVLRADELAVGDIPARELAVEGRDRDAMLADRDEGAVERDARLEQCGRHVDAPALFAGLVEDRDAPRHVIDPAQR